MLTPVLIAGAGLLLGALLNIIIIRLSREQRLLGWPPHCTRTGEPLALWQVLPVVGWALQRGRARNGRPLHRVYPLVELLTALVVVALYHHHGFSAMFFYLSFVCSVLIVTGVIDWLSRYIYTFVILGAALLALAASAIMPELELWDALKGMLWAGGGFVLIFFLAHILFPARATPFGMGDVYLGIFIGAAFGLERLVTTLSYGIFMAGLVAAPIVFAKYFIVRPSSQSTPAPEVPGDSVADSDSADAPEATASSAAQESPPSNLPEYISYGTFLCLGAVVYLVLWGW